MDFRILGPLEVVHDGRSVPLGSAKERVLLLRLLVSANRVVPVESLVEDLWGSDASDQAAANLRVYVSRLRRRLRVGGDGLVVTRPPGYLIAVAPDAVDAARFERLAAEARRHLAEGRPGEASAAAHQALNLWRGPALVEAGGYLFAQPETARLEGLHQAVLEDRIDADLAEGLHGELVGELASLVDANPYRERLWGQLMLALYRAGRQVEALRAYQRLRRMLSEGLGISPGPELSSLEERILNHDPSLAAAAPRPPAPAIPSTPEPDERGGSRPGDPPGAGSTGDADREPGGRPRLEGALSVLRTAQLSPFVGRRSELTALLGAWEQACAGQFRLAVVSGEAGIGKTRLVREVVAQAWADGGIVLSGRCDDGAVVPYQPFVSAASQYLSGRRPSDTRAWTLPGAVELAALVPGAAPPVWDLPADRVDADPATRRYWLFDAFLTTLREAAEEAPVVLVLDDLHWADTPTLRLLRHLVEHGQDLSLLVVGTYRSDESSESLTETLGDLARVQRFERIPLPGLVEDELAQLLASHPDAPAEPALVRSLHRQTEGNPFFVEELLLQPAGAGGVTPDEAAMVGAVPERILDLILRRTNQLPPASRRFLEVAAVAGRSFRVDLVEEVAGTGEDATVDALDTSIRAGLIQEESLGTCVFAHALSHRCVYENIGRARRRRLHRRIGQVLLSRHGMEPGAHLAEMAQHLFLGVEGPDDEQVVIDALIRSGDQAIAQLAYEEAVTHYTRALGLASPSGDVALRGELLLKLGDAHHRAGQLPAAREVLDRAAVLARLARSGALLAEVALAHTAGSWAFRYTPRGQERIQLLEEALRALGDGPDDLRCQVLARLSLEIHPLQQPARAARLAAEAVELARRLNDPAVLFCALQASLVCEVGPDLPPDQHLARANEILRLAEGLGPGGMVLDARQLRQGALLRSGDIASFVEETELMAAVAEQLSLPAFTYWSLVDRATLHAMQGGFAEAELRASEAFAVGHRIDEPTALAHFGAQMIVVAWGRGRLESLVEGAATLVEQFPRLPSYRAALAFILAELGDPDAAAHLDHFAAARFGNVPRDDMWLMSMSLLAMACNRLEDAAAGEQVLELLRPFSDRVVAPATAIVCLGSAATAAGLAARVAGRTEEADRHLAAAVDANRRLGALPFAALALWERALCRTAMGDPETADRLGSEARALAEELGMAGLLSRWSVSRTGG